MSNLLPTEEKLMIHREYVKRFLVIFLALFFLSAAVAFAFLLSSYLLVKSVLVESEGELRTGVGCSDILASEDCLTEINLIAAEIKALSSGSGPAASEVVRAILDSRPASGIRIFSLAIDRKSDGSKVTVSGRAADRMSLQSFEKKLKQGNIFSKVEIPISDFAKERQIDFGIQLAIEN